MTSDKRHWVMYRQWVQWVVYWRLQTSGFNKESDCVEKVKSLILMLSWWCCAFGERVGVFKHPASASAAYWPESLLLIMTGAAQVMCQCVFNCPYEEQVHTVLDGFKLTVTWIQGAYLCFCFKLSSQTTKSLNSLKDFLSFKVVTVRKVIILLYGSCWGQSRAGVYFIRRCF